MGVNIDMGMDPSSTTITAMTIIGWVVPLVGTVVIGIMGWLLNRSVNNVDTKIVEVDKNIKQISTKLDSHSERLARAETRLDAQVSAVSALEQRVYTLEGSAGVRRRQR